MDKLEISIVIPIYNSQTTIRDLVTTLIRELTNRYSFEIILVNDGSKDGSQHICRKLSEENSCVKYISFFKNFGQINAIMAGFRQSIGEIVVVMDDDLQNPPSEIHKLIDSIRENDYDFVFGAPEKIQQHWLRRIGSWASVKMAEVVFGKPKDLYPSSYYCLRQEIVSEITKYEGPFPYVSGLLFRVTENGENIPVEHLPRIHGKSGYTFKKLFMLWVSGLTNFSVIPLRVSSLFGSLFAICGFIYLSIILAVKILNPTYYTTGWPSVIALVLFFSGVLLLALGIMGEYIGRIFIMLNKKPQYAIREKLNCEDKLE